MSDYKDINLILKALDDLRAVRAVGGDIDSIDNLDITARINTLLRLLEQEVRNGQVTTTKATS